MEKKIVAQLKRNKDESIQIAIGSYREKVYVDIRVYAYGLKTGEFTTTKKGITIEAKLLHKLIAGLQQAEKEISVEV